MTNDEALALIQDALEQHKQQLQLTGKLDGLCDLLDQAFNLLANQIQLVGSQ